MVASAADQVVQPAALAPQDDYGIGREIVILVTDCPALIEPHTPYILLLKLFKGADEVDHAGDTDVLSGSGGGLDGDGAEGRRAALGEDDSVDSGGVGGAEQGAEVL